MAANLGTPCARRSAKCANFKFDRDEGLKWAREHGPGPASDMIERIQEGFKR